jgi:hypothetical protein
MPLTLTFSPGSNASTGHVLADDELALTAQLEQASVRTV